MLDQATHISEMTKITLGEGDVLVVKLPRNNLPNNMWHKYAESIRDILVPLFLSNQIIIVENEVDFLVLGQKDVA